jgi:fatty acid desaturase
LGSFVFSVFGTFVSGHVGHDGGHFAVSRIPFINDLAVWCISWLSNPIIWQHQHTYAHHSFTNQSDHDPDLHHFHQLIRLSKHERLTVLRKKQVYAMYVFFAFAFTTFGTCYWHAWRFIVERSMHGIAPWSDRKNSSRTIGLFCHMIVYTTIIILVPFFVHETFASAFVAVLVQVVSSGMMFALASQVGHLTEMKLNQGDDKKLKRRTEAIQSWGADQVEVSNNFDPQSAASFYLTGGLSLQIEHHLFPSLNHCHLRIIQPIVEQTCAEYNVEYKKYDSWGDVMKDTLTLLRNLAHDDDPPKASE